MAVIEHSEAAQEIHEDKLAEKVAHWVRKCEKTLDFVYNYEPCELSVLEALQGDSNCKIFDPYGYMSDLPLSKKVERIETASGKVEKKNDKISGMLVVTLTTGEELSGKWVEGKREGQGLVMGPRLEKVLPD